MNRLALLVLTASAAVVLPTTPSAQARRYALEATADLRLHNVTAEPAMLQGKKGLRVTISEEALRRSQAMTPEEPNLEPLASIEGLDFANGIIEVELAGEPAPGAPEGARGFVG